MPLSFSILSLDGGAILYPNPTNDKLNVIFEASSLEDGQLEIVDALGRIIQSRSLQVVSGINRVELNTMTLAAGIYYVNISFGDHEINFQKFVKTD